jgi:hypothetical protein
MFWRKSLSFYFIEVCDVIWYVWKVIIIWPKMNVISFDIQFGITWKLLCFNSWLDFILHTAWCEMRVGRHSRRLVMVWAIKELRFDYRWVEEISLHFKAPKVFAIIAFSLISTYIFLNLNISFVTLFEGRPICNHHKIRP